MAAKPESAFKRWFVKSDLPAGWMWEFLEPNFGVHEGIADSIVSFFPPRSQVMRYVWVEYKVGRFGADANKTLRMTGDGLRPAQIAWHRKWREAGADTAIVVGVKHGAAWRSFVLPDNALNVPNPITSWASFELTEWSDYITKKGWRK